MQSCIRTLLPVGILLAHASSGALGAVPQQIASSFEASLAASRARAGDVYVNGTANVLLESTSSTRLGTSTSAVTAPVDPTFLDAAKGLQRVNVVVESTTRTVLETDATRREVDIAPVMTEKQFNQSKASMPLGAVVIRNTSDIRPVSVVRTINVADVVIRPRH
ncbi:MAG: hypothetical protein K1X67_10720 [Fimbriimonadaceae bacterium]|nr:hypothetical protein [Fimbriimonadaceae bacterium]